MSLICTFQYERYFGIPEHVLDFAVCKIEQNISECQEFRRQGRTLNHCTIELNISESILEIKVVFYNTVVSMGLS